MLIKNDRLEKAVAYSLEEDIGSGDITAALIEEKTTAHAQVITRESAILCGIPWFNEVYRQVDPEIRIQWQIAEGDSVSANQCVVTLSGRARALVTGERCALNWLQCLSATATQTAACVNILKNTGAQLLDTRKTIPGLRYAQKYAVKVGGGRNHRMGLYDAYLIKENHIASCSSIQNAIKRARTLLADKLIEVEVENFSQLQAAIEAGADIIMLDNFNLSQIRRAVSMAQGRAKLEVSGNIELTQLHQIADTGIDYISMGALTKHVRAIDLSMRFVLNENH